MTWTSRIPLSLAALGAVLAGAAFLVLGALRLIHGQAEFSDHIESSLDWINIAGLGFALVALQPAVLAIGAATGSRGGFVAATGLALLSIGVIGVMVERRDPDWFVAIAPVANLLWLAGDVMLARAVARSKAFPAWMALIPLAQLLVMPGISIGLAVLGGAFWIAAGSWLIGARVPRDERLAAEPAA